MGKVPSRVKFDEDGFPIPQTMQADTVQFDEDGLPIPVKKKATGTDLSMVGGKAVPSGGQVGIFKAPLSEVKKTPHIDIESYNKNFESVSGHKEIDLGSNLPQVKKAKEQSKYLKYRDVEENQIKPLQAAISMGTVTPSQLAKSYNNPLSKNIVSGIVKEQLPDVNIQGLSEDVFGNEKKWDVISREINVKNRQNGLDLQNQYLINLDQDIYKSLQDYKVGSIYSGGGTGGGMGGINIVPFPKIDTNNPTELGEVLSMIQNNDGLVGVDGKIQQDEKNKLAKKISDKLFFLKSQEGVHPEINSVSDKIFDAVSRVNMLREKGEQPVDKITDKENYEQVKLGLNYMKDANPAAYTNIMRSINERGVISDLDYEELGGIGQQIYNQKMFVEGALDPNAIGKETNFDYTTYQTKKMNYSSVLSEELKRMGYTNTAKVPQRAIKEAALRNPELTNWDIIKDIARDEAAGGYGIVKGGALNAIARGIATPIKGINSTINSWIESPVDTYLNSRRYDYGDQIIANSKGEVSGELPSERGNMLYDILEGTGQFIPQVLLARGVGGTLAKAYEKSWFGSPLSEASKLNLSAYPGTFVSTFMQTYGDSYADMLQKTGNVSKSKIVGVIDGISAAGFEMFLPDVKIAEQMKGLWNKKGIANKITALIEKGEKDKVKSAVSDFFKNALNFTVKTGSVISKEEAEELGTQYADYFTEAMFSPSTVKDRDLANEMFETAKQTGLSMIVPAILGAAGDKVQNRKFTKNSLHYLATNFDDFKSSLEKGLANGSVTQQDYNTIIESVAQHKKSMDQAPKRDINGDVISADRQLEYAFQNTVEAINRGKAEQLSDDKTQSEYYTSLADKAAEVKKKIFEGQESKSLPPKQEIEITPEQAVIKKALDNGEITNPTYKSIAEQALENPEIAVQIIDEIKSQANGEVAGELGNAESTVRNSFGNTLTDYVMNVGKEQISQPIELDPNLPEGYQLPEQQQQDTEVNIPELKEDWSKDVESTAKALDEKKKSLDEKAKKLGYVGIKQFNAQNQLNEKLSNEEKELLQEYSDFQQEVKNLKDENVISKLSDDEFSSWSKANDITRDDLGKVVKDEEIELAAKRIRILNARGDSKKADSELKKLKESKKKDNWTVESWKERFDEDIEQSEIDDINQSNKEFNNSLDKAVEELLGKPTQQQAELEQKKAELENERQQKITEATKPVVELELLGDENEAMDLILDKAKGDKDGGRAKVRQHERIRAKFQALKELIDCV